MEPVAQNIFFGVIAVGMVVAALRVVTTKNIVHAALWLILVLAGAAAQFVLLVAEFVATVQVLVYIGAIVVLFLFGIMLTRAPLGDSLEFDRRQAYMGIGVALPLLALLTSVILTGFDDTEIDPQVAALASLYGEVVAADSDDASGALADGSGLDLGHGEVAVARPSNTKAVSDSIFSAYIVPFEAMSVLLLAALMGAIVLARRD